MPPGTCDADTARLRLLSAAPSTARAGPPGLPVRPRCRLTRPLPASRRRRSFRSRAGVARSSGKDARLVVCEARARHQTCRGLRGVWLCPPRTSGPVGPDDVPFEAAPVWPPSSGASSARGWPRGVLGRTVAHALPPRRAAAAGAGGGGGSAWGAGGGAAGRARGPLPDSSHCLQGTRRRLRRGTAPLRSPAWPPSSSRRAKTARSEERSACCAVCGGCR